MLQCPYCGDDNIDGADQCDRCMQPLAFNREPMSRIEQRLVRDRVYMLGPRRPIVVNTSAPVREVLRILVEHEVGCVMVAQDRALVGIFTERDALNRIGVNIDELGHKPIGDYMTPSPEMIEADAEIVYALKQMDIGGYRHLPVLDEGRMFGFISVRDILRHVTEDLLEVT